MIIGAGCDIILLINCNLKDYGKEKIFNVGGCWLIACNDELSCCSSSKTG